MKYPKCHCGSQMTLKTGSSFGCGKWWSCNRWPDCDGAIGAHPDGTPLGRVGTVEEKLARNRAHAAFDPIWQNCMSEYQSRGNRSPRQLQSIARHRSYVWLADRLGIPFDDCHMAMFGVSECARVVEVSQGVTYADIRAWWKHERNPAPTGFQGDPFAEVGL